MATTNETELNQSMHFDQLSDSQQKSFWKQPTPVLVRLAAGFQLYKWTQYGLISPRGFASEYWAPWAPMTSGNIQVPGFTELRTRYQNINGGVGRPQEFARARSAVTQEWNTMSSLTKAELSLPVWGFLGVCAPQPVTQSEEKSRKVLFIGGNYQLVIPNMTAKHIFKL